MPETAAQDPSELFDVVSATGAALGFTKPRYAVHRDGDWHRAVHIWVYGMEDEVPFILFQRRSMSKDTRPGKLDPTVSGHYTAGESLEGALRESREEIGFAARLEVMVHAGVRICASEEPPGVLDRELQDVLLWRRDEPLETYVPNGAELAGLVQVGVLDMLTYCAGEVDQIEAVYLPAGGAKREAITLNDDDLRSGIDRYVYRVAIAIDGLLGGRRHIAV